jgi:hypothetical protein
VARALQHAQDTILSARAARERSGQIIQAGSKQQRRRPMSELSAHPATDVEGERREQIEIENDLCSRSAREPVPVDAETGARLRTLLENPPLREPEDPSPEA